MTNNIYYYYLTYCSELVLVLWTVINIIITDRCYHDPQSWALRLTLPYLTLHIQPIHVPPYACEVLWIWKNLLTHLLFQR